jgi:DNA repair exonuclease SbcCD ATPase subunit
MSTDDTLPPLVERLRSRAWEHRHHRKYREEAAAEIERLNALAGPSGKSLHDLERLNDGLIADNERLSRELAAARGCIDKLLEEDGKLAEMDQLMQERDDLRDEVARLRADAERYRWLRERHDVLCSMYTAQGLGLDLSAVYVRSAEQLDRVIDAAMASAKATEGTT